MLFGEESLFKFVWENEKGVVLQMAMHNFKFRLGLYNGSQEGFIASSSDVGQQRHDG
jgi:hypothetical protein